MSKIEGPQVLAAIIGLVVIALMVALVVPDAIDKIGSGVVTGIVALGLKLLDKNGETK